MELVLGFGGTFFSEISSNEMKHRNRKRQKYTITLNFY
jgi:hypothetical protein